MLLLSPSCYCHRLVSLFLSFPCWLLLSVLVGIVKPLASVIRALCGPCVLLLFTQVVVVISTMCCCLHNLVVVASATCYHLQHLVAVWKQAAGLSPPHGASPQCNLALVLKNVLLFQWFGVGHVHNVLLFTAIGGGGKACSCKPLVSLLLSLYVTCVLFLFVWKEFKHLLLC